MKIINKLAVVISIALTLGASAYAQPNHLKVGKAGELTLAQKTTVGNTVLPAGDYQIHHRYSATGHYMEFSEVSGIIAVGGRVAGSGYEYRVVARVPCEVGPLTATVRQTTAMIVRDSAGAHLSALEIRGENMGHMF